MTSTFTSFPNLRRDSALRKEWTSSRRVCLYPFIPFHLHQAHDIGRHAVFHEYLLKEIYKERNKHKEFYLQLFEDRSLWAFFSNLCSYWNLILILLLLKLNLFDLTLSYWNWILILLLKKLNLFDLTLSYWNSILILLLKLNLQFLVLLKLWNCVETVENKIRNKRFDKSVNKQEIEENLISFKVVFEWKKFSWLVGCLLRHWTKLLVYRKKSESIG